MILRVYGPADCDERGVPLDWERCRLCSGSGAGRQRVEEVVPGRLRSVRVPDGAPGSDEVCGRCGGHGSLKAAALEARLVTAEPDLGGVPLEEHLPGCGWRTGEQPTCVCPVRLRVPKVRREPRCEGCGHPMSDGTWEYPHLWDGRWDLVMRWLRGELSDEAEPPGPGVHYSPCDEGCRHEGPGRVDGRVVAPPPYGLDGVAGHGRADIVQERDADGTPKGLRYVLNGNKVEASWRQVDVRTLGEPHDLRPESSLALLCLRCYAERTPDA